MFDEPGFLAHLYSNPHDDTARLVYADWLEEQGDSRNLYLRLEVELGVLDEWSPELQTRENELERLGQKLPSDWLELVGRRYDVWLTDLPSSPIQLGLLLMSLGQIGRPPFEAAELLGRLPQPVLENVLRGPAQRARNLLQDACHDKSETKPSAIPVRLRQARQPRPKLCRFPGPLDPPGYALRLVERTRVGLKKLEESVRAFTGLSVEDTQALLARELPLTLHTFPTPEAARLAARSLQGLGIVEVRWIEPRPGGRVMDRPLVGRYSVLVHRYPPEVKKQLMSVIRLMTGWSLAEARERTNAPLPLVVQTGLDWTRAEALRLALPARAMVELCEEMCSRETVHGC